MILALAAAAALAAGPPAPEPVSLLPVDDRHTEWVRVQRDGDRWETAYQVLNAVDVAQTCDFLHRGVGHELNPLFGRNPKCTTLIAAKGAFGIAHWLAYRHVRARNPKIARLMAITSVAVQGSVVALNLRLTFRGR